MVSPQHTRMFVFLLLCLFVCLCALFSLDDQHAKHSGQLAHAAGDNGPRDQGWSRSCQPVIAHELRQSVHPRGTRVKHQGRRNCTWDVFFAGHRRTAISNNKQPQTTTNKNNNKQQQQTSTTTTTTTNNTQQE